MNDLKMAIKINSDLYVFAMEMLGGVGRETILSGLADQYTYLQEMEDKMKKSTKKVAKKTTKTSKKK